MGENYITCRESNGSINISEDVVASLVKAAIEEVEGVAGLSNTAGAEIAELIGLKTTSKGIKVQFADARITIDAIITVLYGSKIVDVAASVQEKVAGAVVSATGIDDCTVNVHVSGVAFEK